MQTLTLNQDAAGWNIDSMAFASSGGALILTTGTPYNMASIQQFAVPANASGQYASTFTSVTNNALISGIKID
jgi:hypothetical protein